MEHHASWRIKYAEAAGKVLLRDSINKQRSTSVHLNMNSGSTRKALQLSRYSSLILGRSRFQVPGMRGHIGRQSISVDPTRDHGRDRVVGPGIMARSRILNVLVSVAANPAPLAVAFLFKYLRRGNTIRAAEVQPLLAEVRHGHSKVRTTISDGTHGKGRSVFEIRARRNEDPQDLPSPFVKAANIDNEKIAKRFMPVRKFYLAAPSWKTDRLENERAAGPR